MGTLLDFASAPRPSSRLKTQKHSAEAPKCADFGVVIVFPGVRYERTELDLAARIGTIDRKIGPAASDVD
ncbi:MAG: hypothetical protein JJ902_15535 [Roseibium sp.]|nr:hypothetical protein [Roseibium sp.]